MRFLPVAHRLVIFVVAAFSGGSLRDVTNLTGNLTGGLFCTSSMLHVCIGRYEE